MPLFANKFAPKRIPARRLDTNVVSRELGPEFASRELGPDPPPLALVLSNKELAFDDGHWNLELKSPSSSHKENVKIRKLLKTSAEENNALKLKFEIVLDMLVQTTAELQLKNEEADRTIKTRRVKL